MPDSRTVMAAMAVASFGALPTRANTTRRHFSRDELKKLRASGNRTAPAWVQQQLISKAHTKRERKQERRLWQHERQFKVFGTDA